MAIKKPVAKEVATTEKPKRKRRDHGKIVVCSVFTSEVEVDDETDENVGEDAVTQETTCFEVILDQPDHESTADATKWLQSQESGTYAVIRLVKVYKTVSEVRVVAEAKEVELSL